MLKHHGRALCLAIVCLCLSACFWLLADRWASDAPQSADAPQMETQASYSFLYEYPLNNFEAVDAVLSGEAFTVTSDLVYDDYGALLGVNNTLRQPILLQGEPDFAFDSYAYNMILLIAQNLPITEKVRESAPSLAPYGLTQPALRFTVREKDGAAFTLLVGNLTPDESACYVMLDGTRDVYAAPADLYATFARGLNGLHALPSGLGVTADEIVQLQIDRANAARVSILQKDEAAMAASVIPWQMLEPLTHDVNTGRLKTALAGLCAIAPTGYAGSWRTEADKAAYGLDTPAARIVFATSAGGVAEICVGSDLPGGLCCVTLDRSGAVYTVPKADLAFIDRMTAAELAEQYVSLISVSAVDTLRAATPAGQHTLTLDWTGSDTAVAAHYLIDGAETTRETFTALYAGLVGVIFDKFYTESNGQPGEPILTLTFTLRDGGQTEIAYRELNDNYACALVNGEPSFLVRREKAAQAAELVDAAGK